MNVPVMGGKEKSFKKYISGTIVQTGMLRWFVDICVHTHQMLLPLSKAGTLKNIWFLFEKQVLLKVVAKFPLIRKPVKKQKRTFLKANKHLGKSHTCTCTDKKVPSKEGEGFGIASKRLKHGIYPW